MKNKLNILKINLVLLVLVFTTFLYLPAYAFVELNTKQTFTIGEPGFFPFSSIANSTVKNALKTNKKVNIDFENLIGGPLNVAPAADSKEFGVQKSVPLSGSLTLDFSKVPKTANTLGLSFVPLEGSTTITFTVSLNTTTPETGPTPAPTEDVTTPEGTTQPAPTPEEEDLPPEGTKEPNGLIIRFGPVPIPVDLLGELFGEAGICLDEIINSDILNDCIIPKLGKGFQRALIECLVEQLRGKETSRTTNNKLSQITKYFTSSQEESNFVLDLEKLQKPTTSFNQIITNKSTETKLFATIIQPGLTDSTLSSRKTNNATQKNQTDFNIHDPGITILETLISSKPLIKTENEEFFVGTGKKGDEEKRICLKPSCSSFTDGTTSNSASCTPKEISSRRVKFSPVQLSNFLEPFDTTSNENETITAQTLSGPRVSQNVIINTGNAYVILQPVPPQARLAQRLTLNISLAKTPCANEVKCDNLCGNIGACCRKNAQGFVTHTCQQLGGGSRCGCKEGTQTITAEILSNIPCLLPINSCGNLVQCIDNLGKCCEADTNGKAKRICKTIGGSFCGCVRP